MFEQENISAIRILSGGHCGDGQPFVPAPSPKQLSIVTDHQQDRIRQAQGAYSIRSLALRSFTHSRDLIFYFQLGSSQKVQVQWHTTTTMAISHETQTQSSGTKIDFWLLTPLSCHNKFLHSSVILQGGTAGTS